MKVWFRFITAVLSAPAVLAFVPVSPRGETVSIQNSATVGSLRARPFVFARRPASSSALRAAAVNVDERASRDLGAMEQWAAACGVQRVNGFQLTSQDGLDWSVVTSEPLAKGSPVLSVPANMILSSARAKQELGENVKEAVQMLGMYGASEQIPQFYLFAKVLAEYEKGDQSPYFPWLNSLPRLYFNAVSMTDFCYECLPPLVFSLARKERVKFDNFYEALQKVSSFRPETKSDKDLAKWAFNVVYTRCWGPDGGEKQIVPMADMFNHGTETEVAVNYDGKGNCIIQTTKDVEAGAPLRRSYGDPTNPSHFFATYGFLDETSPATFCKIMNIQPNKELLDIGYGFSKMLFYRNTGDISMEVWDVMLYQILNSNKAEQKAFYEAHMRGDFETKKAIHQRHFLETSTALKTHVDTFLKQLDELSAKAIGKDLNEHPRLPLILKHNEFVKKTFLAVKARLDPMVAQAAGQPVGA